MRATKKFALGLVALGAVSCGPATDQAGDPFYGVVDGSGLEAKFLPNARCNGASSNNCYAPQSMKVAGATVKVFNFGLVFTSSSYTLPQDPANGRLLFPLSKVGHTVYELTDGCVSRETDPRLDAYVKDRQFPVFDYVPSATQPAPALGLYQVKTWSGTSGEECNAVKSHLSLEDGTFGGTGAAQEQVAVRLAVDPIATLQASSGMTQTIQQGWFKGLLTTYVDAGTVPVDANGNLKFMTAVLVQPNYTDTRLNTTSKVTDSSATVLLQAAPGSADFSPVVRLLEVKATKDKDPKTYTGLCQDDCTDPTNQINVATGTFTNAGFIFLAPITAP